MGNAQIHIEGIPFTFNKIVKQLKQDMKDDWFPDPLNHEDSLNPAVIVSKFLDYDKRPEIKYSGHEAYQYNIPKPGFSLRYALETSLWDRLIYQGIAGYLINFCDRHLNTNVFSHRWSRKPDGRYLFNHQIEAWKKFQNSVKVNLTPTTPWLLVTDVQNYFENIRIEDVKSSLTLLMAQSKLTPAEDKIAKRAVNVICSLLKKWSPYKRHGIPQNRDASSFVGNAVMHSVDCAMINMGYSYYRFMDDIRVVCKDPFHARKALKDLIIQLRKLGLNVNPKKSFILAKDSEEIEDHLLKNDRSIQQIDALLKTKRLFDVRNTLPLLRKMVMELITRDQTQERAFRFCLNRLENIAKCTETRSSFKFDDITDQIIKELTQQPYSTDSFARYLKCVDITKDQLNAIANLLLDSGKSIYSWQNYHLWQLVVNHKFISCELLELARKMVNTVALEPNLAGAIHYLGACGNDDDKILIARKFANLKSYLVQRNAMIATHELSYKKYIKPLMQEYVREDLKGTYRTLADSYRGIYFASF